MKRRRRKNPDMSTLAIVAGVVVLGAAGYYLATRGRASFVPSVKGDGGITPLTVQNQQQKDVTDRFAVSDSFTPDPDTAPATSPATWTDVSASMQRAPSLAQMLGQGIRVPRNLPTGGGLDQTFGGPV